MMFVIWPATGCRILTKKPLNSFIIFLQKRFYFTRRIWLTMGGRCCYKNYILALNFLITWVNLMVWNLRIMKRWLCIFSSSSLSVWNLCEFLLYDTTKSYTNEDYRTPLPEILSGCWNGLVSLSQERVFMKPKTLIRFIPYFHIGKIYCPQLLRRRIWLSGLNH